METLYYTRAAVPNIRPQNGVNIVHHNIYSGSLNYLSSILIYIQQDATLHRLFYLEIALHVSGGTSTHHQERIQLYLQYLVFVTALLLPVSSSR